MIIEMHMQLGEDCIISCYYYSAQGDYSKSTKFQNGYLRFCQCYRGSAQTMLVIKFGVTLFKRKTWSFCQVNLMNLSNPSGNWLYFNMSNQNNWNRMGSTSKQTFTRDFKCIYRQLYLNNNYSPYTQWILYNDTILTFCKYLLNINKTATCEGSLKVTLNKVNLDMLIAIKY